MLWAFTINAGLFCCQSIQFILDYPLAFAMLGLAGFFKKNIYVGCVVGAIGRFICHFISGIVSLLAMQGTKMYLYIPLHTI